MVMNLDLLPIQRLREHNRWPERGPFRCEQAQRLSIGYRAYP